METISDRLKYYIGKFTDYSIRGFEEKLGWPTSTVNNLGASINEKRALALKKFDQKISLDWLLCGFGDPRSKDDRKENNDNIPNFDYAKFEGMSIDKQLSILFNELENASLANEKLNMENNIILKLIGNKLGIEEENIRIDTKKEA